MKMSIFIKLIFGHIYNHKGYSLFCILGAMLTFIFITLLLQFSRVIGGHTPPVVNADKIINIPNYIESEYGKGKWMTCNDVKSLMSNVCGYKFYTCTHYELGNMFVNGKYIDNGVLFVDVNYWKIFQYDFIKGKPWEKQDENNPCIIVNAMFANEYFASDNIIGETIEFQGVNYKIIGVVSDVSLYSMYGQVSAWIPDSFNRNITTGNNMVETNILFPESMETNDVKSVMSNAIARWSNSHNLHLNMGVDKIYTIQDVLQYGFGGDYLLLGIWGILFMLLSIPVLNIVLLNIANTNVQESEIGLRRALGSSRLNMLVAICVENFVLILIGTMIGILLVLPLCNFVDSVFLMDSVFGKMAVLPDLDWNVVIFGVFPLSVLFSLLSGGIPAYFIIKQPILNMLKGGSKC